MTPNENCLPRLERMRIARATLRATIPIFVVAFIVLVACSGPQPVAPSEDAVGTAVPEQPPVSVQTSTPTAVPQPTPTRLPIDGATWILEEVDGQPLIDGNYATLTIDGSYFGGFDGCNSFGGRHESGQPVVKRSGQISVPPFAMTAAGCPTPEILDHADRYLEAMMQQATARVVDDRLHIVDPSGKVALVFVKQRPLAGRPVELAGTSWRLLDEDATYGDGVTTLVFLHPWAAVGTTACRDYQIGYTASNGSMRVPSTGMAGSTEPCSGDAERRETRFVEDLGWANEYSLQQVDESEQMVVRTSRGKTLTFEPINARSGALFDQSWQLIRFLEARSDGSSMRRLTDRDPEAGADITATFSGTEVEGALGCHSYALRRARDGGTSMIGPDGEMDMEAASLSTENSCDNGAVITRQQQQYLDLLASAEQYHVFEDRLVVVAVSGDALMFQSTTAKTETTTHGDFFSQLSPEERECLGPDITSGRDIFAMLTTNLTTGTEALRCLSAENQFLLYMGNAAGPEELNEDTHRCIWNSMAQLLGLDDLQAHPPTESDLMGQMMTMMVAMPLYCAATHQPALEPDELGFEEDEAGYIVCAIDAAGGREAWIRMLMENGTGFHVFLQAEGTCGEPTPRP